MKQTEHLKLRKPEQEDYYEIDDHNYNSDILDQSISGLQADVEGKAPNSHSHSAADLTSGTVADARLPSASTTSAGIVQLNNTLTSTSTTQALTAAQGKALQDGKAPNDHDHPSITGNAASASKLQTARQINGVEFDGTKDITIQAEPAAHSHSGTDITTGTIASARLPSASTTAAGIVQLNNTLTGTSTTQALTAAQGKVLQDAVSAKAPISHDHTSITGNAASASKLQTARQINGVEFDGTKDITVSSEAFVYEGAITSQNFYVPLDDIGFPKGSNMRGLFDVYAFGEIENFGGYFAKATIEISSSTTTVRTTWRSRDPEPNPDPEAAYYDQPHFYFRGVSYLQSYHELSFDLATYDNRPLVGGQGAVKRLFVVEDTNKKGQFSRKPRGKQDE